MRNRIISLVILEIFIIIASLGIISYLSVNASIQRSLKNRITLANIISRYLDHELESNLKRLYDISLSGRIDFQDDNWEPEKKALQAAYEYSIFTDRIFLMDSYGTVVLAYPHQEDEQVNLLSIPYVGRTISEGKPVVSDVYTIAQKNKTVIFALVPLKNKDGKVVGVAGGEINPTNYLLAQIIRSIPVGEETYIEMIDSHGVIIASNDPRRILTCNKQYSLLCDLIKEKKTGVQACHRCKGQGNPSLIKKRDMLAFAPLSVAPWGISVREAEEAVYSPSTSLRTGFFALFLISIVTASLLAIGLSRSIVRPIQSLIEATERIGRGNLEEPIVVKSDDEIGILGESFDEMREKLADSLDSIQKYNIELEERVAERTRELEQSREKLSILLREIIHAEEEERKRIARELHDDTSQALNAFLIALDSIIIMSRDSGPVMKQLIHVREQCLAMLKGIHSMIKDLRPPVLDDLGLESAVRWVLEKHLGEKGISFKLKTKGASRGKEEGRERVLEYEKIELVLFRIVQEAIINVTKHADASNVVVTITFGKSFVQIYIEDDGRGFDIKEVLSSIRRDKNTGLGLLGMQERIALVDGQLNIYSKPGGGTKIHLRVPI